MAYVYRIDFHDINLFYFGCKTEFGASSSGLGVIYFSSSKPVHKIIKAGYEPTYSILADNLTKAAAVDLEQQFIREYKLNPWCLNGRGYFGQSNNTRDMSVIGLLEWIKGGPEYPFVQYGFDIDHDQLMKDILSNQRHLAETYGESDSVRLEYAKEQALKIERTLEATLSGHYAKQKADIERKIADKENELALLRSKLRKKQEPIERLRKRLEKHQATIRRLS